MNPAGAKSNPRSYDATGRRERARQQRLRTLDRARELFLARGYTATTVDLVADEAGVSSATIYKTYGGKAGLVRSLCEDALAGTDPMPAHDRSERLRTGATPREVVDGWGALLAEVSPRVSPLLSLLRRAAESDGEAAALYQEQETQRLDRMGENARFLAEAGHLRAGVGVDEARDVLYLCSSSELYEVLVVQRGWTSARLGTFAAETMAAALLSPGLDPTP